MRKIRRSHGSNKRVKKRVKNLKEEKLSARLKKVGFVVHKKSGKYISGTFWSLKNNKSFVFRSTYEFAYFYMLENNRDVSSYIVEPFSIPYKHPFDNKIHKYWPDILILYTNGDLDMIEIKPKSKVEDPVVQRKALAAKAHIRRNNMGAKYRFITEEDIFHTSKDYVNLKKMLLKKEYVL